MKILITFCLLIFFNSLYSQTMQATIKAGNTPRTIDVYLKSSASFSQKDESMTLSLAIPSTVSPAPTLGASGTTANNTGSVSGITGLVPNFLVNNFGATQREVYISKEKINGEEYYVYAFIFATTATSSHDWVAGVEQLIFSIQFNGCISNCDPIPEMLVSLPNGGNEGRAYWYFQANTLGDITNYQNPFYKNSESSEPSNGGSTDGSALSTITLSTAVSLPVKLNSFDVTSENCHAKLDWVTSVENNLAYYCIERSENGVNFSEISKVNPSFSGAIKAYTFQDNNPTSAFMYYRLRMVDKDGKSGFSKILPARFDCLGKKIMVIYPTASKGLFTVRLSPGLERAQIKVINAAGQHVASDYSNKLLRTINLNRFPNGIYMVELCDKNLKIESAKIMVAH